jgi:hypothetical protein
VAQAVVVEDLLQVAQAPRLEQVLEIGVPEPEATEPGAARFGAAVAPVEEAPLPTGVHLDRPGHRPVQADELDVLAHPYCGRYEVRATSE